MLYGVVLLAEVLCVLLELLRVESGSGSHPMKPSSLSTYSRSGCIKINEIARSAKVYNAKTLASLGSSP